MLVVITGPSGVGKTTIIKSLMKMDPNLRYSSSLTTRQPRPSEVDGGDYHFVSHEEFRERIKKDEFVEWSEVYGEHYGRLKRDLDDMMHRGDVLVGIDVQGAMKLKDKYPEGIFIFMLPKSEAILAERLKRRKTDNEATVKTRLDAALQEMKQANNFSYKVINDKISETVNEIQSILTTERRKIKGMKMSTTND